ncbi:Spo0E family sporulation regulatory protein-aspartic acid phosphatase [Peribacillus frigoritolerans]|uniref:Spo0E family sporulation regulatory protein-aspartic acid phosphatase n=1 Tax=Peribacillus frigoritolerans TaxID=450367 RepID=UPI003990C806
MGLLHKKIETMRKELINTALKHRITPPKTLHINQELEKLSGNWGNETAVFPSEIPKFHKSSFF